MKKLDLLKEYCAVQAENERIWFIPEIATEAYLLNELRKIVWMIEEATDDEIKKEIELMKEDIK